MRPFAMVLTKYPPVPRAPPTNEAHSPPWPMEFRLEEDKRPAYSLPGCISELTSQQAPQYLKHPSKTVGAVLDELVRDDDIQRICKYASCGSHGYHCRIDEA